jgi:hypothetical protein
MAGITAANGGTFNATTIEGQMWQSVHWIELQERLSSDLGRFSFTKDDSFVLTGEFTLPGTVTRNADGTFTESAAPYLPAGAATFVPGTGGTIRNTTIAPFAQYFIDVCKYIVTWQNNPVKNTQNLTNVTLNFNFSELEYSGRFNLPYQTTLGANGSIVETATEWLLT